MLLVYVLLGIVAIIGTIVGFSLYARGSDDDALSRIERRETTDQRTKDDHGDGRVGETTLEPTTDQTDSLTAVSEEYNVEYSNTPHPENARRSIFQPLAEVWLITNNLDSATLSDTIKFYENIFQSVHVVQRSAGAADLDISLIDNAWNIMVSDGVFMAREMSNGSFSFEASDICGALRSMTRDGAYMPAKIYESRMVESPYLRDNDTYDRPATDCRWFEHVMSTDCEVGVWAYGKSISDMTIRRNHPISVFRVLEEHNQKRVILEDEARNMRNILYNVDGLSFKVSSLS